MTSALPFRDPQSKHAAKLYAASPEPVILLDAEARVRYANLAASRYGEFEGRTLGEFLDPFSRSKAELLLAHVTRHGFASGWELNLNLDGPQLVSVTALELPDSNGHVLLFIRDASLPTLTALRLIEANATLDEQNQVLSQLLETQNQALTGLQARPSGGITLEKMADEVLSAREQQVLLLMAEGLSNQEIAERLVISLATVKTHVRHILQRLGVEDRSQAVIQALHRGLIRLGTP